MKQLLDIKKSSPTSRLTSKDNKNTSRIQQRITRLQLNQGENDRGYTKANFIITVPISIVDQFNLRKGDVFAWSVLSSNSPVTLKLTKVPLPGDIA
ncbi:MAG TPA: hypothetical protein VFJ05_06930 [Nitrososphaeraceae archaeon]|nr:hypothetical protein [Nitrososphaeraceae archaeon]